PVVRDVEPVRLAYDDHATLTIASACWPNGRSSTVRSAAITARPAAVPAVTAKLTRPSACPASAVRRVAGSTLQPGGTTSRTSACAPRANGFRTSTSKLARSPAGTDDRY